MKSVYISVTNDLVCDARAHRTCLTLSRANATVTLVGRKLKNSPEPEEQVYHLKRFRLPVNKGFFFYMLYNARLLLYLITRKKVDILVACDLDTLPANYLTSVFRRCVLVFDSHEYFTEVPELQTNRFARTVWLYLEKFLFPRLKIAYTVSNTIAEEYAEKYGLKFDVVRNLPLTYVETELYPLPQHLREMKKIIYQGAVNIARGIELMKEVVMLMDNVVLIIAGDGDIFHKLREDWSGEIMTGKVYFTGRIHREKLAGLTIQADMGFSMEEDLGKNYRYALPNKLFDYIQARIPVLVSDLPEMRKVVEKYEAGLVAVSGDPLRIKEQVEYILYNTEARKKWQEKLEKAAVELNWENEEKKIIHIFTEAGLTFPG